MSVHRGHAISRLLFKIEGSFFFVKNPLINGHLLYEYFVRWSVNQATKGINVQKGKRLFFCCYLRQKDHSFFVKIPMINNHLLYEYLVRWSVSQATKGINVQKGKRLFFYCYLRQKDHSFCEDSSEHLFFKYFVRLSANQATKDERF